MKNYCFSFFLILIFISCNSTSGTDSKVAIAISFSEEISTKKLDGRMLLMLSNNDEKEPRFQIGEGLNNQLIFGMNVDQLAANQEIVFDETIFGFPIKSLQNIYQNHNGLEAIFAKNQETTSLQKSISEAKKVFFELEHPKRTTKHFSDPMNGSAAKRINMFLRWMIRQDNCGVDFGIWKTISPAALSCPLDVHSGNVARKLGLLHRTQNDAKALAELDAQLRILDPNDPVKYDFAICHIGMRKLKF